MPRTPNTQAGGAGKGACVLIGHHDSRSWLLHSTHVVKFWRDVSVLLDAKEQQWVAKALPRKKGDLSAFAKYLIWAWP